MARSTFSHGAMGALADAAGAFKARVDAEYHGREVELNKPMKGDIKKSKVYVKNPRTGNVKKVEYGDPNMRIKKNSDAHRESYCARSAHLSDPGDKTSANYWSRKAWNC